MTSINRSNSNYTRLFNLQARDQKENKVVQYSYYVDASNFSEAQDIANLIKLDESAPGHKREFKITSLDLSNLPSVGNKSRLYEVFENFYSGAYLVDRKVCGVYLATEETIASIIQSFTANTKPKISAKDDYSVVDAKVISIVDLNMIGQLKVDSKQISTIENQRYQLASRNDEIQRKIKNLEREMSENKQMMAELEHTFRQTTQRLQTTRQTIQSHEDQAVTYHAFPCPRCKSIVAEKGHVVQKPNGGKTYHCRPFW